MSLSNTLQRFTNVQKRLPAFYEYVAMFTRGQKSILFNKRNHIFRGLPVKVIQDIQLDWEAGYSSTPLKHCEQIFEGLLDVTGKSREYFRNCIFTDLTACVGASAMGFATHFKCINAIEYDALRYSFLKHNIYNVFHGKCNNIVVYNGDCMDVVRRTRQHVMFLDPPWGGTHYNQAESLSLTLDSKPLHEICLQLSPFASYLLVKVPYNFDFDNFTRRLLMAQGPRGGTIEIRGRIPVTNTGMVCEKKNCKHASSKRVIFFVLVYKCLSNV